METEIIDAKGLKCPQPILKIAQKVPTLQPGDTLTVLADCHTFEKDVKNWCSRTTKSLLEFTNFGDHYKAVIQI